MLYFQVKLDKIEIVVEMFCVSEFYFYKFVCVQICIYKIMCYQNRRIIILKIFDFFVFFNLYDEILLFLLLESK